MIDPILPIPLQHLLGRPQRFTDQGVLGKVLIKVVVTTIVGARGVVIVVPQPHRHAFLIDQPHSFQNILDTGPSTLESGYDHSSLVHGGQCLHDRGYQGAMRADLYYQLWRGVVGEDMLDGLLELHRFSHVLDPISGIGVHQGP